MAEYFDAYQFLLDQHYRTWDTQLCHWSRFDWSLEACMYKHFHDFLVRHLLDVHSYYVVIYFDDIYYGLMMFGRIHTRKWDLGILFLNGMGWRSLLIIGVQCKQWDPGIVFCPIDFKLFGKQAVWEMDSPLNKVMLIRVVQHQAWWFLSEIFMKYQRLKVGSSMATSKNHTKSRFFNNYVWNLLRTSNIGKGGFVMSQIWHWVTWMLKVK